MPFFLKLQCAHQMTIVVVSNPKCYRGVIFDSLPMTTLRGHTSDVLTVVCDSTGNTIYSGGLDTIISENFFVLLSFAVIISTDPGCVLLCPWLCNCFRSLQDPGLYRNPLPQIRCQAITLVRVSSSLVTPMPFGVLQLIFRRTYWPQARRIALACTILHKKNWCHS